MTVKSTSSFPWELRQRRTSDLPEGEACEAPSGHCITCGDEGIPMRVIECQAGVAVCTDDAHERHEVAVDLVGPVQPGDRVLVHAGVAIGHLGLTA